MIYLDYSAAMPIKPAVLAATVEAMERVGHPHSLHRSGRVAAKRVEEARSRVAALIGAPASKLFFTKGGLPTFLPHLSLTLPPEGRFSLLEVAATLRKVAEPSLVSFPLVDSVTGIVQPARDIAALARSLGHSVLLDVSSAIGRLPLDFDSFDVAMMFFAADQLGGPQGCGALVVSSGMPVSLAPVDEATNVPALVGFGVAAQLAIDDLRRVPLMRRWRDKLEGFLTSVAGGDLVVVGAAQERIATASCLALEGVSAKVMAHALDAEGLALGFTDSPLRLGVRRFDGALRLSFGWATRAEDLRRFASAWGTAYEALRQTSSSRSYAA